MGPLLMVKEIPEKFHSRLSKAKRKLIDFPLTEYFIKGSQGVCYIQRS